MTDPITSGVVGCGEITSKRRAGMVAKTEGAEIKVAMDTVEELARDIGERFDVPWTTDYQEVLDDPIRLRTLRDDEYGQIDEWTEVPVEADSSDSEPLIVDFVDAVRSGRRPRIGGIDGIETRGRGGCLPSRKRRV